MITETLPVPVGTPSLLSHAFTIVPWALAALYVIIVGFRRLMGGGFDTMSDYFLGMRRVSDAKRDPEMDALKERIEGLSDMVQAQQGLINAHEAQINSLRYDLADNRTYAWEAYGEIRRLDPHTSFGKPPALRMVVTSWPLQQPPAGGMPPDYQ